VNEIMPSSLPFCDVASFNFEEKAASAAIGLNITAPPKHNCNQLVNNWPLKYDAIKLCRPWNRWNEMEPIAYLAVSNTVNVKYSGIHFIAMSYFFSDMQWYWSSCCDQQYRTS
jgi:hypothetical protein